MLREEQSLQRIFAFHISSAKSISEGKIVQDQLTYRVVALADQQFGDPIAENELVQSYTSTMIVLTRNNESMFRSDLLHVGHLYALRTCS